MKYFASCFMLLAITMFAFGCQPESSSDPAATPPAADAGDGGVADDVAADPAADADAEGSAEDSEG